MFNSLNIIINNDIGIFHPKQIVKGIVELKVVIEIDRAKGLSFTAKGFATSKWIKGKTEYCGEENLLNFGYYFFGSKVNCEERNISVGVYSYKFSFQLPESCPSSIERSFGNIRYVVEASLDVPWKFDLETQRTLDVVRLEDLNLLPRLRVPYEIEKTERYGFFCFKSGPMVMRVRIPKTGFALGEKIPIRIDFINHSSKHVLSTRVVLKRIEEFNTNQTPFQTKQLTITVTKETLSGARRGETVSIEKMIEVPRYIPITNNFHCKVLQIKYFIKIKAVSGTFTSTFVRIPVTIGTVAICDDTEIKSQPKTLHKVHLPSLYGESFDDILNE